MPSSYWLKVQQFDSSSSPGTVYWVSIHTETKVLGCNCPRWRFKREGQPRSCKHLDKVDPAEVRKVLGLTPGSAEFSSRVINMADPDPIEVSHGKQWWAKRNIEI